MNALVAVAALRDVLGESTAAYWSNQALLNALNRSQLRLYMKLSMTPGDWLVKKKLVSFTNGEATLPADCAKPVILQTQSNQLIPFEGNVRVSIDSVWPGYEDLYLGNRTAFLYGKTVKLNYNNTEQVYLWYEQSNRDLHMGTVGDLYNEDFILDIELPAEFSRGFTLDSTYTRKYEADYYNGLYVDYMETNGNVRQLEILDYSGSLGICVVDTETDLTTGASYGLVSCLPKEAEDVWLAQAAYIAAAKPAAVVDKEVIAWLAKDMRAAEDMFENWISTRVKSTTYMLGGTRG